MKNLSNHDLLFSVGYIKCSLHKSTYSTHKTQGPIFNVTVHKKKYEANTTIIPHVHILVNELKLTQTLF